ncbi:MAG: hypothetical protein WEA54_02350 [Actinomycetota bacterium]
MATIDVALVNGPPPAYRFDVTVTDADRSFSAHEVTLDPGDLARLGSGYASPEAFVHACFAFLLERESKGSILPRFDVRVIARYFPEFEETIDRP